MKDKSREVKRAKTSDCNFSHARSDDMVPLDLDKGFPVNFPPMVLVILKIYGV